ncbi:MAG: PD-(D/E)XK nuclease family protein [Prevotellaceae bacterium]|jgi:CRISPR/Cas system-associated exonuclease Cas4 (RecB family)|nr:PD-(D/E)XK nuclease family protein [Prevotellaceae bacterium]
MSSPTPFLQQVAHSLHQRYGDGISNLTLVFPSRRARLYFAHYLSLYITKPLWQPQAVSIDEVFASISGLRIANSYKLVAELYKAYTKNCETNETFDHFYFWGEVMLSDFDSVDKYMVNVDMLLQNLRSLKSIDSTFEFLTEEQRELVHSFWRSFSAEKDGRLQKNFIDLWSTLPPCYRDFRQQLREQGLAYQGMLYREGAELLKQSDYSFGKTRYVFVGFNALNECEKVLLRRLKQLQIAEYYWDTDTYYLNNRQQEAGLFMRQNIVEFPPVELDKDLSLFSQEKDIQIVAAPSDVLQAKLIPQLLDEVREEQPLSALDRRTAIVLADEGLLIPTLYSIPEKVSALNITMGYPLLQTPVYSLTELLIKLHKNARKTGDSPAKFYHKDVLAILNHQYIRTLANDDATIVSNEIAQRNLVFISIADIDKLHNLQSTLIKQLLTYIETPEAVTALLIEMFKLIAQADITADTPDSLLRSEYVTCAYQELNKLNEALKDSSMQLSMSVFLSLLRSTLKSVRIPFEGEPIAGLQLMGILETRALDFEKLIILSLNEDIYPRSEASPSLIPYNLRKAFGLPTIEQHEAMYAYYFYRLLQRSKHIRLLYNNLPGDTRTGEMSRYLRQLCMESPHNIPQRKVDYSVAYAKEKPIVVKKNAEVAGILKQYLTGGNKALSASAINMYMDCPLKFYLAQIAKLREPEELIEEVNEQVLGNIFHHAMQQIYQPYLQQSVDSKTISAILSSKELLNGIAEKSTAKIIFDSEESAHEIAHNGKHLLAKNTVLKYIIGTLEFDAKRAPFTVEGLEKKVDFSLPVLINGQPENVNITGYIDRIDSTGHITTIVDYKTGSGADEKTKFKSIDALFGSHKERRKEVLQILLYSLIIKRLYNKSGMAPALYFVRNIYVSGFSGSIKIKNEKNSYTGIENADELLPRFTELLNAKLAEIFDSARPFVQTDEVENCEYCTYGSICHRKQAK